MGWRYTCNECGESWLNGERHSCPSCGRDSLSWTTEEAVD